jgi:uncharacterized membrane protein
MGDIKRPWEITTIQVLASISGVFAMASGIFMTLDRNSLELAEKAQLTADQLLWTGILLVVIGAIKIALASALGNGSEAVRTFFTVIVAIGVAAGIWGIFALHGEQRLTATIHAVFGIITIWLLLNAESRKFFESTNR